MEYVVGTPQEVAEFLAARRATTAELPEARGAATGEQRVAATDDDEYEYREIRGRRAAVIPIERQLAKIPPTSLLRRFLDEHQDEIYLVPDAQAPSQSKPPESFQIRSRATGRVLAFVRPATGWVQFLTDDLDGIPYVDEWTEKEHKMRTNTQWHRTNFHIKDEKSFATASALLQRGLGRGEEAAA